MAAILIKKQHTDIFCHLLTVSQLIKEEIRVESQEMMIGTVRLLIQLLIKFFVKNSWIGINNLTFKVPIPKRTLTNLDLTLTAHL
jgi:hypothetical protein